MGYRPCLFGCASGRVCEAAVTRLTGEQGIEYLSGVGMVLNAGRHFLSMP